MSEKVEQDCLCVLNSDFSKTLATLTFDDLRDIWVTLQWRLCKTPEDDPCFADLEILCKKIARVLAKGFGS